LEWSIVALKEEETMLGVKQEVIKMIQSLPDEVTIDDIMAELYFKLQVDAGLKELDEGKGIPHQEVEKRMSKWLLR
jgi:predicted transcriptional regulator